MLSGFATEPDADGWWVREPRGDGTFLDFYGRMMVRVEGPRTARLRLATRPDIRNIKGHVHGGYLLAVVDQALFVGPSACGFATVGGATVDVSSQFLAPVLPGPPIDAISEVLKETGRMLFIRGLIEQDGVAALAFSGTVRKPG